MWQHANMTMQRFGLKTVFSKLFASVMMTLVLFAVSMIALTHLVHDNSANTRWQVLATQIVRQIDPFVDELDNAITMNERLQARFMLAVIKKSLDIFDESLQAKMGLYDRHGKLLVQTDDSDLPTMLPKDPAWVLRMLPTFSPTEQVSVQSIGDRGYILLYEPRDPPKRSEISAMLNLFTGTLALLVIMTGVLWWIARSMTWRINRMSARMSQLGEGDFSVRVPANGTDEIASLAKGFNQAAQKIEQLINANNLLLAHASHELRTPITRIRLQIEMMEMLVKQLPTESQEKFHKRAQAVNRDLTGLNDLVESILLVSRLDAGHVAQQSERFDLYELVNQECQHYPEAKLYGQSIVLEGQPKLLIHLIRNLLNNAMIHGTPPIEVHLYGAVSESEALAPPKHLIEAMDALTLTSNSLAIEPAAANPDGSDSDNQRANGAPTSKINSQSDSQSVINTPTKESGSSLTSEDTSYVEDNGKVIADSDPNTDKDKKSAVTPQRGEGDYTKESKKNDSSFTKRLRRPKPAKLQQAVAPNFAVIAVIDHGKGIPPNKRAEIFSPFVRLQQHNKGSGLGLSLVSQIVEAHHGNILTDTYNGQTRFLVILPTKNKSKA